MVKWWVSHEVRNICCKIRKIIKSIWNKEELPQQWMRSITFLFMWRVAVYCFLYKKDNNINFSKDRDTIFCSTMYKILSNIFLSGLTGYVEGIYWEWQCGFQRNRLATEKILCFVFRASRYIRVMKTNLMHYLSSVHFLSQPLRVSGTSVAGRPTDSQLESTTRTSYCIYTVHLLMMGYRYTRNM
jgi:hypothetical protein